MKFAPRAAWRLAWLHSVAAPCSQTPQPAGAARKLGATLHPHELALVPRLPLAIWVGRAEAVPVEGETIGQYGIQRHWAWALPGTSAPAGYSTPPAAQRLQDAHRAPVAPALPSCTPAVQVPHATPRADMRSKFRAARSSNRRVWARPGWPRSPRLLAPVVRAPARRLLRLARVRRPALNVDVHLGVGSEGGQGEGPLLASCSGARQGTRPPHETPQAQSSGM